MRACLLLAVLALGCGERPAPPAEQRPPEVASAVAAASAFLDGPDLDTREVCDRGKALAKGYYPKLKAEAFLARPSKSTVTEALFLVCFAGELPDELRSPIGERVASLPVETLSGYPESPERLRAAWKPIKSTREMFEQPKARAVCGALSAKLWQRMKDQDAAVQKIYQRIMSSRGGPILAPILDGQLPIDLVVEATGPIPVKDGKPRFTADEVETVIQAAFKEVVRRTFAEMGADDWYYNLVIWPKKPDAAAAPVTLRVRYSMAETAKSLSMGFPNAPEFKTLKVDLRLQFELDGKPLGDEIKVQAVTPDMISWDEYKEGPDNALLQMTLSDGSTAMFHQLVLPR